MKKLVLLFLSVVCVLCLVFSLSACGNSEQELEQGASQGLKYELSEDGESYKVTGIGSFDGNDLVIPSKYKGKPVTSIGQAAFYDCRKLTNVTIPDSVTTIGDDAFDDCRIKKATVPAIAIEYIKNSTLESVTITSGEEIPEYAFQGCNLTSITIPNTVTTIGDGAFAACDGLTSITIPNSVTTIGSSAFEVCTGLTSITIPDGVTTIGSEAFAGCLNLTSITLPDSVKSMGVAAFSSCSSLTSVTIGNGVTSIDWYSFNKCKNLTNVTIGNSVTSIGESAFSDCEKLKSITLPKSLTSIGGSAFYGCEGLTSATFEDTSNWYVDHNPIDVTNPSNNAKYLSETYPYKWEKKEN